MWLWILLSALFLVFLYRKMQNPYDPVGEFKPWFGEPFKI
jgi:hypothetical protein